MVLQLLQSDTQLHLLLLQTNVNYEYSMLYTVSTDMFGFFEPCDIRHINENLITEDTKIYQPEYKLIQPTPSHNKEPRSRCKHKN